MFLLKRTAKTICGTVIRFERNSKKILCESVVPLERNNKKILYGSVVPLERNNKGVSTNKRNKQNVSLFLIFVHKVFFSFLIVVLWNFFLDIQLILLPYFGCFVKSDFFERKKEEEKSLFISFVFLFLSKGTTLYCSFQKEQQFRRSALVVPFQTNNTSAENFLVVPFQRNNTFAKYFLVVPF